MSRAGARIPAGGVCGVGGFAKHASSQAFLGTLVSRPQWIGGPGMKRP